MVDCTLGYGGHAREILERIQPGGRLIGLDVDPVEQPKTEKRLREAGFGPETFLVRRSNYAGIAKILMAEGIAGVDAVLADLGVSSMQLDDPARGFSIKNEGLLDMRMNPERGQPASDWLRSVSPERLASALEEYADEPRAETIAPALAGKVFATTNALNQAIRETVAVLDEEERELTVRRVFQAVRIAVNEEFSALESFLRVLPNCLKPGGRVAVLAFHSGEDRRVKKSFQAGVRGGIYSAVAEDILRPSSKECHDNSRAKPAKLRWAVKA
jgi:16S rRNA (cytosine1402-N4)-methyltransferase